MKKVKEILNSFNSNPFTVLLINIVAVVDFIILIIGNPITQIAGIFILIAVVLVLLQRFLSYKKIKTKAFENIYEAINNYNMYYKKYYEQIEDETIISVDTLDSSLSKMTDCIERVANNTLECKVCICIKLVSPENLIDNDYKKWSLRTIARSSSTSSRRRRNDSGLDLVGDNTDFCSILENNANNMDVVNGFISYDLDETARKMKECGSEYRNSHKDFEYKATIVYPIQFNTSSLPQNVIRSFYNDDHINNTFIVGFLCLDTEKTFTNEKELFEKAADLMYCYCDSIAPIIKIYSLSRMKTIIKEECFE